MGDRAGRDPARAAGPQYRARGRARRAAGAEDRARRDPDRRAGGSCDARRARFQQAASVAALLAGERQARDLRHRGARTGDRIRLHPPRRRAAARPIRSRSSSRSRRWMSRSSSSSSGDYYWNSGMFVFKASRYLSTSSRSFAPDILEAATAAFDGGQDGPRFRAHRQGGVRDMPQRLDRLCRHGEDRLGRGLAARCRLERCGLLGIAVRCVAGRRGGQRAAGRRAGARHARLLRALDQPPGDRRRHGRSRHRRDQGCRAGGAQGPRAGRQGAGARAEEGRAQRVRPASRGVPALGQLRQHR